MAIRDKTTTNKWTYERSHKTLKSYSLVQYNKIYPNTNFWKTLPKESSWHGRFWQSVFLKHFKQNSSRHLSVKQKIKKLHTINKKHVHKERKETTHGEIGERMWYWPYHIYIYIYIYLCIYQINTRFAITKWSQDQCTRTMYQKDKEKKRYKSPHYIPKKE